MPKPNRNRKRLGDLGQQRRLALGRTIEEVAKIGGLGKTTVSNIENSYPVKPRSLFAYDRGVSWTPGSAARVLDGGDPTPLEDPVFALTEEIVEAYMPAEEFDPDDELTHPEDREIWSLRRIPPEGRRYAIGIRRAQRAQAELRAEGYRGVG